MTYGESTSGNYAQMPLDVRKQLALEDPSAARTMALGGLIVLSTEEGYHALEDQAKRDLAVVLAKQQAIGASYAADADEMENTEQQYLKAEMPAYAAAYAESRCAHQSAVVYHEDLPGRVNFGTKFSATIQYPERDEPTVRNFILLGPGEATLWRGGYADSTGQQLTVISYLSPIGRALWGVDVEQIAQSPLSLQLPNNPTPAQVLGVDVLGQDF